MVVESYIRCHIAEPDGIRLNAVSVCTLELKFKYVLKNTFLERRKFVYLIYTRFFHEIDYMIFDFFLFFLTQTF